MSGFKPTGWLASLDIRARNGVLDAMRVCGAKALQYAEEHRRLSPPPGTIAVGGSHMDPFFLAEGLEAFLSALRQGQHPDGAWDAGRLAAATAVKKWNESRKDFQVHRWTGTCDALLNSEKARILEAAEKGA